MQIPSGNFVPLFKCNVAAPALNQSWIISNVGSKCIFFIFFFETLVGHSTMRELMENGSGERKHLLKMESLALWVLMVICKASKSFHLYFSSVLHKIKCHFYLPSWVVCGCLTGWEWHKLVSDMSIN